MLEELRTRIEAKQSLIGVEISLSSFPSFLEDCVQLSGQFEAKVWDMANGLQEFEDYPNAGEAETPLELINYIEEQILESSPIDQVYFLWGLQPHIKENKLIKAKLLSLALRGCGTGHTIVLLDPSFDLPEFSEVMPILTYNLPDREQIEDNLTVLLNQIAFNNPLLQVLVSDRLVRSCQGLTLWEIGEVLRVAVLKLKEDFEEESLINEFNTVKMGKLKRLGVEFSETPDVEVGGLSKLKSWLQRRTFLFNHPAQSLPQPKGVVLVGVPGAGKSLIAKNLGKMLNVPVMRLDFGSIYQSLVGQSEANLRRVLRTCEAIAPCCLYIDELEKAFGGVNSGTSTDNGVSQRLFGTFLTWMAEKTAPVFVVGTANKVNNLPVEFLRKGRFDEIFFVDLPNYEERLEIIKLHLLKARITVSLQGVQWLAEATEQYTGSEIAHLITEARILSLSENRTVTKGDFEQILGEIRPLAETQYQAIDEIRAWARQYARPAS
ncbi:MAG: AAA family ATPase [Microcystaceae cyanobacterium]